jgi:hypothetical protein
MRTRSWSTWEMGEELEDIDLAQRSVPREARDLVRRDGVVAAAQRRGIVNRDLWLIAVRGLGSGELEVEHVETFIRTGPIIDVIAFNPAAPENWRLERGAAAVLGVVECQALRPPPVRIWPHPLAWLEAGGNGLCLLSDNAHERRQILMDCQTVLVKGVDAGRALMDSIAAAKPADPHMLVEIG